MNTPDPENYKHFEAKMIEEIQKESVKFLEWTINHFSRHGDKWGPKDGLIYPLYLIQEVWEIYKNNGN